ncbi:hypothetical protein HK098_006448 [Nowakowskiella sp. JEL0407]|nr:hypothetical protein HK098_006448 [Nowakowskiella sp. JEL0407]
MDKQNEGLKLMADGDKAISKKSFFGRSSPDFDQAVQNYEQAANCFKLAKAYSYAVDAYVKSADCHTKLNSLYLAAKNLDAAALMLMNQLNKPDESSELYRRASNYYLANGSYDRAAEVLEKAGKALESINPDKAVQLYEESCTIYETEDKMRSGAESFQRFISFLIKSGRYPKALELSGRLTDAYIKMENRIGINKQVLSCVILALAYGDEVEAGKRFDMYAGRVSGFGESDEGMIAANLLDAYEQHNPDLLADALKRQQINYLNSEITRLARTKLRVPGGGNAVGDAGTLIEEEDDGLL